MEHSLWQRTEGRGTDWAGKGQEALANEVMFELSLLDKGQSCADVGEGGAPQAEETARLTL